MLMDLLADEPGVGRSLADIARHLGVAKATCYPMVIALTEAGWLLRHPTRKTYQLGPAMVPIGLAANVATDVVDLARSAMHSLADDERLACVAFVPSGADLVVADIVQPISGRQGTLGLRLGDKVLLAPPLGAGVAAWYNPDQLKEWYTLGEQALDEDAAALADRYGHVLELVRERGFAVECMQQQQRSLADAVSAMRGQGVGRPQSAVALREARRLLSADVLVGAIDLKASYQPISVNSVVFGPDGDPVLVVCAVDVATPISGAATRELGVRVREAAMQITAAVQGRPPMR